MPWSANLAPNGRALSDAFAGIEPERWKDFLRALSAEAVLRHQKFITAIQAYRKHGARRSDPGRPVLWRRGTTALFEGAGPPDAPAVLLIPSLVNRAYILDLTPRTSVVEGLAKRGIRPFLLDWDEPGDEEAEFSLTDYVVDRLEPALAAVRSRTGRPVVLLGYCMGGQLALALAQRRLADVAGLVLLATPWDFHAGMEPQRLILEATLDWFRKAIPVLGQLPVDILQALFTAFDPDLVARKYIAFGGLPKRSAKARDFVLLEDWVNDGVPLAPKVAMECLEDWYHFNTPARGQWKIAGEPVLPNRVSCPSLAIIPERDRIVTPSSARSLSRALPNCSELTISGGHVGMLLSRKVGSALHRPIASWIKSMTK